jgi:uncharacterized protein
MSAPTPCARCGCCCWSSEPGYIPVFGVDLARLGERVAELTEVVAGQRAMRFVDGRCTALRPDDSGRAAPCTIHAARPDACRWLEPGSSSCRAARAGDAATAALGRSRPRPPSVH